MMKMMVLMIVALALGGSVVDRIEAQPVEKQSYQALLRRLNECSTSMLNSNPSCRSRILNMEAISQKLKTDCCPVVKRSSEECSCLIYAFSSRLDRPKLKSLAKFMTSCYSYVNCPTVTKVVERQIERSKMSFECGDQAMDVKSVCQSTAAKALSGSTKKVKEIEKFECCQEMYDLTQSGLCMCNIKARSVPELNDEVYSFLDSFVNEEQMTKVCGRSIISDATCPATAPAPALAPTSAPAPAPASDDTVTLPPAP